MRDDAGRLREIDDSLPFEAHYRTKGLLHSDPPDHTRLRRLISRGLSPRVIETMLSGRTRALPAMRLVDTRPSWDLEKANSRVLRSLPVAF
jgi:cytochrome P450